MKQNVRKTTGKALTAVLIVLCLLLTTGISAFAANGISNEQIAAASKIARQMEDEGLVLLKNDDSFLPLKNKKVNVFGIASCDLLLSGGGSGSVVADEAVDFYEGLKHGGIRYNKDLKKVYEDWKSQYSLAETGNGLIDMLLNYVQGDGAEELPIENISDEVMASAREFSDTALIVFGSAGTELADLKKSDLRLNETQRAMLDAVTSNFENVIVVFNTSNTMEMDWVEQYDSIKAAILMWLPG
ncbi:MAG: glycoside hydrolase family 3 C-terminal domain-containing protein, partial [Clostridia bacterium]|nr:glycoside hydrolase family 3 C-terminal domain-containing protein [Clostridia bacterium]